MSSTRIAFSFKERASSLPWFRLSVEGEIEFTHNEIILDPSVLFYMTCNELEESEATYYLPAELTQLISRSFDGENNEYRVFLKSFLNYFGDGATSPNLDSNSWDLFRKNYNKISVVPITDSDVDNDSDYNFYLETFNDHDFYISLSPFKNFLGACIGKIVQFSKKTGRVIVTKSRKLFDIVKDKITSIDLPRDVDKMAEAKQKITSGLFKRKGLKGSKSFIAIALAVGGTVAGGPVWGVPGIVLAVIDP